MDREEAEEIISEYEKYSDRSCTCFQSAPCAKCENSPLEEEYDIATTYLENLE